MKVINLIIVVVSCLLIGSSPGNLSVQCIDSLPDDSRLFGASLAMSDNYLAVGDPGANRVVIFNQDKNRKWSRIKEILPPKDSVFSEVNNGFGYDVALDRNILAIVALTREIAPKYSLLRAIYKTNLDQDTKIERIDDPIKKFLEGRNVVADDGKIAFVTLGIDKSGSTFSKVDIFYANERRIISDKQYNFFVSLALKNNLLLVGYSSIHGGAWLFDLNQPNKKPDNLFIQDSSHVISLAISEQFAVVSTYSGHFTFDSNPKTLIRSLKNNSTTIMDNQGKLSLDNNILARYYRPDPFYLDKPNTLELFYLDNDAKPHLIEKRQSLPKIENILVKNGLLTTVQKSIHGNKICIETVSK